MKQVVQSLKSGEVEVVDVPLPIASTGALRIRTTKSLISAGTERMMVEFGRGNWLQKARQQPDKVRMVLDKARTDGIAATLETVRNKLEQPIAPGYSNVGIVDAVGSGVSSFAVGDRVVSNGKHAEFVIVPQNLCARIPDGVCDEDAAFTVVGAIALQGIRLAQLEIGARAAVMGLGLIGLLTVQLLKAQGCRVIGFDFDAEKVELAKRFGAEALVLGDGVDPVSAGMAFSRGRGLDAVIITASTDSDDPVRHAAQMSRQRGRVILVGVAGLNLSRADFYEKELTFQVSCSYGPGRYDPRYEEGGIDYPFGFVRWTEQRNFEAVLDVMASGSLDLASLRSHLVAIAEAPRAYEIIGGSEPSLGVLLDYLESMPSTADEPSLPAPRATRVELVSREPVTGKTINMIGAGNYASAVLIPALTAAGADLRTIASPSGLSASNQGRRYGFASASSDVSATLADENVSAVVIATRHESHASLVVEALGQGKHVFVEKPLAMDLAQVDQVEEALATARPGTVLMVGFNRRFAPAVVAAKAILAREGAPKSFVYTINAGAIPADSWIQDAAIGGGRIIGELCHFVDLLRYLADAPIVHHHIATMDSLIRDTAAVTLGFADGSIGTIQYFANGSKSFPKERLEIFTAGKVVQIDNFRRLRVYGTHGGDRLPGLRQDKGQRQCVKAFVDAVGTKGPGPIPVAELFEVARVTLALAQAS